MATISAHEQPVLRIFNDDHAFRIPDYQRPYRWGVEQAGPLYQDILDSAREAAPLLRRRGGSAGEHVTPYFLGSVVMVKEEPGRPESDVVDGQQRLTTLSLLIAALRVSLPEDEAADLKGLLFEKGRPLLGTTDRCRLTLRERDHAFYQRHVLENEGLRGLEEVALDQIPEPQANIARNVLFFRDRLRELPEQERSLLATYLLQHTYLVLVATRSLDSAFRIFSVLNDRGLDLTAADILKAEIIGAVPPDRRDAYTRKWEETEERLGGRRV